MAIYLILVLFMVGIWGMIRKDNIIKKIMALSIFNAAVIILFVYAGSIAGTDAPILVKGVIDIVDPLPQALMLTAIVIGICITALALSIVTRIYGHFTTLSLHRIEAEMKKDHE